MNKVLSIKNFITCAILNDAILNIKHGLITFVSYSLLMGNSTGENNKKNKNLEQSQNNASEIGDAESNPETSGPAGDLRKAALEATTTTDDNSGEKEAV
ncbi:MAG: hypothetical protein WKF36_11860 [Candidatus Nitrosocosmicus sp.]